MRTSKKALLERYNQAVSFDEGEWLSTNVASAALGFGALGYSIKGFKSDSIKHAPLDRRTIVKGSIHNVRTALWLLGCEQPENVDIPKSLMDYTHRKMWRTTLGEVRSTGKSVFVKPADVQKGFRGHILHPQHESYLTKRLRDDYAVLASEVVNFWAEWRVYVLRGEILGVCFYEGDDCCQPPSTNFIKDMIRAYKDAPAAYAIDIGQLPKTHALVEVNEGFSCGNYGISNIDYAKMVEARWKEMTNT